MTSEQEKAIKRLEKRIKDNEDYKTTQVWLTDDVSAVYTILNMLKERDKEIEKYKSLYNKALADLVKADRKNIENEMVIDLMAETIRKLAISLANYKGSYNKETINFTGNIKDIKQYFERKASNEY